MRVALSSRCVFGLHGFGGMERYVHSLSQHLVKNGVDVEIVTSMINKVNEISGKTTFLPPNISGGNRFLTPLRYRRFLRKVSKYLKNKDIDLLHSFGIPPPEYLKYHGRKPVIAQPFGSEEFKAREKENVFMRIYVDLFIRKPKIYGMQHADAIASEGDLQTQEIVDLFKVPRKKIFPLPDGVDLDLVEEFMKNTEITREDLGLEDADLVLMNVNRLTPNKGVPYLISALKMLNETLNVKLILVGSGPEEGKIKNQIRTLELQDKVFHFKNISDKKVFQLYTLADISVTPTLYEGLPLVVLEAMASGKPIVASNVSEVPQVVKNGVNGFLVEPANPKAVADAVSKIFNEGLTRKMGKRSRAIVGEYDWDIIAKKAIRKYRELTGK